ncbi:MAG: TonB-dependent receptor [Vicinamibacteria bacterium]|nr:TonB-dependent receptor [Vicinamibacteria bacterium]
MKFSRAWRMCLSLSLVALSDPLFAQQTGVISGSITDTNGGVLPGVTVEARSNVLPGPRATTSGGNGDYRLPALPPGEYTVTFTLSGMQTVTRKATVQLSQETALDAKLGVAGLTEAVTVTAAATFIDKDSATVATGLSSTQLAELPTGTEYRDLMKLIPGIQYTQDSVRGPSAGGSGQDNVYNFDGVNVTLPLFGTLAAEPSSHDIAEVIVVKGGARAVDFDRAGGLSIDSVSKTGTDKFKGQVDYRFQTQDMTANLKAGTRTRYDQDRAWTSAGLGGPLLTDRLFFYASYYRPTVDRANQANVYGELPAFNSTRNEEFGKLTFTPSSNVLLNASYRYSKRLEVSDQFSAAAAPTTGTGGESTQKIFTADGSWVINPNSYATFKFTKFSNPGGSRPDFEANATPSTTVGTRLDIANLDTIGRFSVPTPISGQTAFNSFIQPLIDRYGYNGANGKAGGGIVGYGLEFNNQDFYRDSGQVGYNLTVGGSVKHDLHFGAQMYKDSEDLIRSSNGWGQLTAPGGRISIQGQPVFYQATFGQQTTGAISPIHSEYESTSLEFNDTIRTGRWTFNIGAIASRDTLYGQDLKEDASTLSGYVFERGTRYKMYQLDFGKMIQPRLGATWAYNGKDTLYASFAQYKPAASSLPRAASWARNLSGARVDAYFDQSGTLFAAVPVASSSGKLFVPDMTPRRTDEFLLGTAKTFSHGVSGRLYGRYRAGSHFWEDTNNTARTAFNPPATVHGVAVPKELYIPDLNDKVAQIGSGSSYVIAELDGAYTRYWEGTAELDWRGEKGSATLSLSTARYYGNFDQDNSTTGNDAAIFIGSSNIADAAGRQLWDFKDGTLRGDRPFMMKLSGSWRLSWNATVGAFFFAQSGQPWEMWSYEPYRALTTSTSSTNRYAEKAGSRRSPSHNQLDLNYTQSFKLKGSVRLQLIANVFNLYNKQTGYNFDPFFNSATFAQPRNYFDPRRLEVTARLRF